MLLWRANTNSQRIKNPVTKLNAELYFETIYGTGIISSTVNINGKTAYESISSHVVLRKCIFRLWLHCSFVCGLSWVLKTLTWRLWFTQKEEMKKRMWSCSNNPFMWPHFFKNAVGHLLVFSLFLLLHKPMILNIYLHGECYLWSLTNWFSNFLVSVFYQKKKLDFYLELLVAKNSSDTLDACTDLFPAAADNTE